MLRACNENSALEAIAEKALAKRLAQEGFVQYLSIFLLDSMYKVAELKTACYYYKRGS